MSLRGSVTALLFAISCTFTSADPAAWTPAFESPLMNRWGMAVTIVYDRFYLMAGVDPDMAAGFEFEKQLPLRVFNDVWSAPVSTQGLAWTQELTFSPWSARARPRLVNLQEGILLMSGVDKDNKVLSDVWWASHTHINRWSKVSDFPWHARDGFAIISKTVDGTEYVVICGGLLQMQETDVPVLSNDVWKSTDQGRSWQQLSPNQPQSTTMWSPRIWMGNNGNTGVGAKVGFEDGVSEFDISQNKWTQQPSDDQAPNQKWVIHDNSIVVFGGFTPHRLCNLMAVITGQGPYWFGGYITNKVPWCELTDAPDNDPYYFGKWDYILLEKDLNVYVFGGSSGVKKDNAAVYYVNAATDTTLKKWHTLCVPRCDPGSKVDGCGGECPAAPDSDSEAEMLIYQVITFGIFPVTAMHVVCLHYMRHRQRRARLTIPDEPMLEAGV